MATHGVVGPKKPFFERAFGKDFYDFKNILMLPQTYIILRKDSETKKLPQKLQKMINRLSENEKELLIKIILNNDFHNIKLPANNKNLNDIINIYKPTY